MVDYREIKKLTNDFYEKYGGMMTITDVARELGTSRSVAKRWLEERVPGIKVGERIKYESRMVAKAIVNARGFY